MLSIWLSPKLCGLVKTKELNIIKRNPCLVRPETVLSICFYLTFMTVISYIYIKHVPYVYHSYFKSHVQSYPDSKEHYDNFTPTLINL